MTANYRRVDVGIVQRGKSYRFTVCQGYDKAGKQLRRTMTYRIPDNVCRRSADRMAREAYIRFSLQCREYGAVRENLLFSELVEEYFETYAPSHLKKITICNYYGQIRHHFAKEFEYMRLKDFTPAVIRDYFSTHRSIRHGTVRPLAPATVKRLYHILQSLFHFAMLRGYLQASPCRGICIPRDPSSDKRMYLTSGELTGFQELFQAPTTANTIILTLLHTGMRVGECLALRWEDIDFSARTIMVCHTLSYAAGQYELTLPKTKTSKRMIYMDPTLYDILCGHRSRQQNLIKEAEHFPHPEIVFTSDTGNYKARNSLYTSLKRITKDTPYSFMTLHKLRHTNATLLLNNGIDLKVVSEHLGHSGISVTADIYTAVLDQSRKKTAETIGRILTNTR